MSTITTRAGKGSPLTNNEVDANFTNLNTDKAELSGAAFTGNITFTDNSKAIFGAGSDLQIYHDGSNSYIDETATGHLFIRSNGDGIYLRSSTNEEIAHFNVNGSVKAYYDNSLKFETTSTGIDVTGTATMDALTSSGTLLFDAVAINKINSNGFLYYDVPAGYTHTFTESGNTKKLLDLSSGGDISFYEDTGTTAKFFWDASAESLGIGQGVFSGTQALNLKGEGIAIKNDKSGSNNNWSLIRNTGTASTSNVSFVTGSGEAMVLDHNRNVGIGTSSPSALLQLEGSDGTPQLKFLRTGTNIGGIIRQTSSPYGLTYDAIDGNAGAPTHVFRTSVDGSSFTERMRIDASGNLLVGKTTASIGTVGCELRNDGYILGVNDGDAPLFLNRKSSDGDIAKFYKDGASVGSIGVFNGVPYIGYTGGTGGGIMFNGKSIEPTGLGTSRTNGENDIGSSSYRWKDLYLSGSVGIGASGSVRFNGVGDTTHAVGYDSTVDGSFMRGQNGMRFMTGTGGGSERMRIDSAGNVGIGLDGGYKLDVLNTGGNVVSARFTSTATSSTEYGPIIVLTNDPNDTTRYFLEGDGGGNLRFRIYSNGNIINVNNSYTGISDEKLKENIVDAGSQWDDIKALRVRKYSLKEENASQPTQIGVIAQEVEAEGMSGLVYETADQTTAEDGSLVDTGEVTKAIKYSILYMKAVKALQEAMDRIETLETRIAALEE